jgi:hypothetical protein
MMYAHYQGRWEIPLLPLRNEGNGVASCVLPDPIEADADR